MKICKCGSFAINDDPDGVLCDKCLLQAEIDKLRQVLEDLKCYEDPMGVAKETDRLK